MTLFRLIAALIVLTLCHTLPAENLAEANQLNFYETYSQDDSSCALNKLAFTQQHNRTEKLNVSDS
jgi:hypothetical protein